jgi:hypothetical protein
MAIESAFGLLKGRSRILLIKKIDLPFHHLLDIIIIYLSLHNLIILYGNAFDMDYAREVEMHMEDLEIFKT